MADPDSKGFLYAPTYGSLQYGGSVVFNIGFGLYIHMTISSLNVLANLPRSDSSRRLLLPYTLALLLLNTAFAVTQNMQIAIFSDLACSHGELYLDQECSPLWIVHSVLVTLPIFANDALFLYRVGVLVKWQLTVMLFPVLIYLASFALGVYSIYGNTVDCPFNRPKSPPLRLDYGPTTSSVPELLWISISLTALLNLILGAIIGYKLYSARRSVLVYPNGRTLGSWYARLTSFIIESALLWTIASVLCVLSMVSDMAPSFYQPFFELLFGITTILSPALLTYQIAREKRGETIQTAALASRPIMVNVVTDTKSDGPNK